MIGRFVCVSLLSNSFGSGSSTFSYSLRYLSYSSNSLKPTNANGGVEPFQPIPGSSRGVSPFGGNYSFHSNNNSSKQKRAKSQEQQQQPNANAAEEEEV